MLNTRFHLILLQLLKIILSSQLNDQFRFTDDITVMHKGPASSAAYLWMGKLSLVVCS